MLATYGIVGYREPDFTGVWIAPSEQQALKRKICAIGVHMSRWVSLHGLALNVNTDLGMFDNIVPCGINEADMEVTSVARELGKKVDIQDAKYRLKTTFAEVFQYAYK
jgi:lipoyl(octanoyl) transferase